MLILSLYVFATAAVTAVLVGEKLKWYKAAAALAVLGLAYAGGVYAFTPALFRYGLWMAALPLGAYVLSFLWYAIKRGWVSTSFFIIIPVATVAAGYALVGPFGGLEWLKGALASVAETTGYKWCTVSRFAAFFFVLSGLVYLSSPANAIIKAVLRKSGVFPEDDADAALPASHGANGAAGRGAIIGALERWIAFVLVLTGQYTALAFVIAAKSIARYKKINEEEKFGEYFLIGTLTSIGVALIFGLIVKRFFL